MSLADLLGGRATETHGLAPTALRAHITEHVDVDAPLPELRVEQRRRIADVVEYLAFRGETRRDDLVELFFRPDDVQKPAQGRYVNGGRWFRELVAPELAALECVDVVDPEATISSWRFTGIDPDAVDDDADPATLDELRATPEYRARGVLDERGVPRRTDERDAVMGLWRRVRGRGEVMADDLGSVQGTGLGVDDVADDLAALPGVERTVDDPDPADLPVETMADVIEGRERLERGAVEVWRAVDDA